MPTKTEPVACSIRNRLRKLIKHLHRRAAHKAKITLRDNPEEYKQLGREIYQQVWDNPDKWNNIAKKMKIKGTNYQKQSSKEWIFEIRKPKATRIGQRIERANLRSKIGE